MLSFVTDASVPGGLARTEVPEPEPGPSEAVVRVKAYSVSRGEVDLVRQRPNGFRPGQEFAGVVTGSAQDGSGPSVGSRVVGLTESATWSERVAVACTSLGVLPDGVTWAQACALAGSGLMARRALERVGDVARRRVLVTGATGAVGNIAVQLAALAGAEVAALVSGPHRVDAVAARAGITVLTELSTADGPFDVILDGIGGSVLPLALRVLAPGGVCLTYGGVTGEPAEIVASDFRGAPGARLEGFFIWLTDPLTFGRDLESLAALVADGRLVPLIGKERDWEETPRMIEEIRLRTVVGKAVLLL